MITTLVIACLLLLVVLAVLAVRYDLARTELAAIRHDRDRLEQSVRHNVRLVRSHVAYLSPEACATCDYLESAVPSRSRVDHVMLERRLTALRRAHNATLLDAAGRGEGGAS